jgi:hypothetical protein
VSARERRGNRRRRAAIVRIEGNTACGQERNKTRVKRNITYS